VKNKQKAIYQKKLERAPHTKNKQKAITLLIFISILHRRKKEKQGATEQIRKEKQGLTCAGKWRR